MTRRRVRLLAAVVALGSLTASCGGSTAAPQRSIIDLGRDAGAGIPVVDPARRDVLAAGDLRLTVEELLADHGLSAIALMRAVSTDAPDVDARLDDLAANTRDLTGAIGLVYGPVGARAFEQLWSQHTQAFLDYAGAADDGGRRTARAHLHDYERDFASFVDTATGGGVPASAVEGMLREHNAQMLGQLDALRAGDAAGSVALLVASMEYLPQIGKALGAGFAAQQPVAFPGPVDDERLQFCSLIGSRAATTAALVSVPAPVLDGELRRAALARVPGLPDGVAEEPGAAAVLDALVDAEHGSAGGGLAVQGAAAARRAAHAAYALARTLRPGA